MNTDHAASMQTIAPRVTHEEAFRCYLEEGQRSYVEVARLLKVPAGTVNAWAVRHGWAAKARDIDAERALTIHAHSLSWLDANRMRWLKALDQLASETDDARVKLEANKHLIALSGLVPLQRSQVQVSTPPPARSPEDLASLSDAELDALIRSSLPYP